MRNRTEHHTLVMQAESGIVEERKSRKEEDPEVNTLGVKGRSELFDIVLIFAEKLKENVEKNINETVNYANTKIETDLNLTSLFDDQTINVKLILIIDGVEFRKSSACSAYLFGLLLLIFRQN